MAIITAHELIDVVVDGVDEVVKMNTQSLQNCKDEN